MKRSDETGDAIREASRNLFSWFMIAVASVTAIVVGLAAVGYHIVASINGFLIERACSVEISWWMRFLWMVAPFGPAVLFVALRGFVVRSNVAAALIAAAMLGAVFYMDFLLVGVPGGPAGQYDTNRGSYCNLMRSLLPAR